MAKRRSLPKLASDLNEAADQPFEELFQKLAKSTLKKITGNLAKLTEKSSADEIQSSRNIFYRLLADNKNLNTKHADICHEILLKLAALRPINQTCVVTLGPIDSNNVVYVSTGHKFDKTVLLNCIKKAGYKNPYDNLSFSKRDIAHLKKCIPELSNVKMIETRDDQLLRLLRENNPSFQELVYRNLNDLIHNNVFQASLLTIASAGFVTGQSSYTIYRLFRMTLALAAAYCMLRPMIEGIRGNLATLFQPAANGQNQPRRNQQPTQP